MPAARSKYAELGEPSAEWEKFHEAYSDFVPVLVGSATRMRNVLADVKKKAAASAAPPNDDGLKVHDEKVSASDGADVAVRVYEPANRRGLVPGFYNVHGGGWTLGDLEGDDAICRDLCAKVGIVVASVDYRLAPEHPFPRGLEDSWEGLQWFISNSSRFGVDPDRLVIGGTSSGGHTTAVLSHRARKGLAKVKGAVMRIPVTCHYNQYPPELELHSFNELTDAPVLCRKSMEHFYENLAAPNPSDPEVSPLLNTSFEGHPPVYMQIAGMDPLRDEAFAYADKLRAAKVPVKVDVYPGLPHGFFVFPPLQATAKATEELVAGIKYLLNET